VSLSQEGTHQGAASCVIIPASICYPDVRAHQPGRSPGPTVTPGSPLLRMEATSAHHLLSAAAIALPSAFATGGGKALPT
jgi:hypothetical protein